MSGALAAQMALCARLWGEGAQAEAIARFRVVAAQHPGNAEVAAALAAALLQTGAWEEGVALMDALGVRLPARPELHDWHAQGLLLLGRAGEAIATLRRRVARHPGDPRGHFLLAHHLLATGALAEGWAEYAWRWQLIDPQTARRRPREPHRRPDPAAWRGRTVLLYSEQGHGDTIQCLRYLPLVRAAGARAVLAVQPGLVRLVRAIAGEAPVVPADDDPPGCDAAVPLFNLPWAFGTTLATIPGQTPYLAADPGATAHWRRRLAGLPGLRVGLVWAGAPNQQQADWRVIDRQRSMTLAALAPLAAVPGTSFVSLQKGAAAAQAAAQPAGPAPVEMVLHDWTDELGDFADTAALMEALDLVITVDTGPAHLAGALGRPVWLLNRFDSCWRWLRDRDDSPWYPTLRQFRQAAPGDWAPVIRDVAAALSQAAARAPAPGSGPPPP